MLRLTGPESDETLRFPGVADGEPSGVRQFPRPIDSTIFAEEALTQAERRMQNLLDLVERFGLDAPGQGPRVA